MYTSFTISRVIIDSDVDGYTQLPHENAWLNRRSLLFIFKKIISMSNEQIFLQFLEESLDILHGKFLKQEF